MNDPQRFVKARLNGRIDAWLSQKVKDASPRPWRRCKVQYGRADQVQVGLAAKGRTNVLDCQSIRMGWLAGYWRPRSRLNCRLSTLHGQAPDMDAAARATNPPYAQYRLTVCIPYGAWRMDLRWTMMERAKPVCRPRN